MTLMTQARSHRIVIVGGGAGGLELAVRLAKAGEDDVLLVDRDETHVWKPRLHELAAGLSSRVNEFDYAGVAEDWGFAFHQGAFCNIDPGNARITLDAIQDDQGRTLAPECSLGYQVLVLALGGVTPDLGVDGVLDHAMMLDNQFDARAIFQRFSAGLLAHSMADNGDRPFNVAIVGSGATGVELGAHLATDHVCKALAPHTSLPSVNINILEAADTFMPGMDDSVRQQVTQRLGDTGVGMHAGQQVSNVSPEAATTGDGSEFPAQLTVWATGRVGPPIAGQTKALETNKKRQWRVGPTLQTNASEAIFAFGDCAYCEDEPAPPTAQAASEQAEYLATTIPRFLRGAELEPFEYQDQGTLLSLGEAGSLGKVRGLFGKDITLHGRLAHTAYRGLQRRHQYIILGVRKGTARMLSDMIGQKAGPRLKVHWTQD